MARFKINTPGVRALAKSDGTRADAMARAREVARAAKKIAPYDTGAYRRSIKATVFMDKNGWCGRVNAFDFKAEWIEFGTAGNAFLKTGMRKYRVLGTALDAALKTPSVGERFQSGAKKVAGFLEGGIQ